ncbi:MAG TPA: MFS transporter [Myxococcota bacterium]|jgi:PPP family 3-phenylpropionic acid transporter|nr:MFS transporter [Myxococcota bacterium]
MRIAFFYFVYFAAVGILLPYLPPHYKALGFNGKAIAVLGSLTSVASVFVPLAWGWLADRARRPTLLFKLACAGAAVAFAPLLWARSFAAVAVAVAGFSVFYTPITSLADSVAVVEARRLRTDYARLRLWGSAGFVASSYLFGAWLARGGAAPDAVPAALALLAGAAVAVLLVRPVTVPLAGPTFADARRLATDPALLCFLLAGTLHWAAAAPFHMLFAIHLRDLGVDARWVGTGLALAVSAEVAVMYAFRRLAARLPLFALLAVAFIASAVRWTVVARAADGRVLAAIQLLHGLGFGAFFVASIAHLERAVPEALRATGRALFASLVFGAGGLAGNVLAGTLYDAGGGRLAYAAAAALELAAPLLLWGSAHVARARAAAAVQAAAER